MRMSIMGTSVALHLSDVCLPRYHRKSQELEKSKNNSSCLKTMLEIPRRRVLPIEAPCGWIRPRYALARDY